MQGADIAWILAAFSMVLLMFPGLAMLYGGMLNGRSVLNMMMMVMSSLGITAIVYVIVGHGLVMGNSVGSWGLIGNPFEFSFYQEFLHDNGKVTHEIAKAFAESEFEQYRVIQDRLYESDFDRAVQLALFGGETEAEVPVDEER